MRTITRLLLIGCRIAGAILCTTSAAVAADPAAPNNAQTLVTLMRVDDGVVIGVTSAFKRSCQQAPGGEPEQCEMAAALLSQEIDHEHLAQLLAPFFEQHFSSDELEVMRQFYGSAEGAQLTELAGISMYNKLNPGRPKHIPAIEQAATKKILDYQRSAVYSKYARFEITAWRPGQAASRAVLVRAA